MLLSLLIKLTDCSFNASPLPRTTCAQMADAPLTVQRNRVGAAIAAQGAGAPQLCRQLPRWPAAQTGVVQQPKRLPRGQCVWAAATTGCGGSFSRPRCASSCAFKKCWVC